jgi:hypothetical protein
VYHFGSLPQQEEKSHHASLLMIRDFDLVNAHFDLLYGQSVGDSIVAIEQRMGLQI